MTYQTSDMSLAIFLLYHSQVGTVKLEGQTKDISGRVTFSFSPEGISVRLVEEFIRNEALVPPQKLMDAQRLFYTLLRQTQYKPLRPEGVAS